MDDQTAILDTFRETILADPDVVLEDREVMRALVAADGSGPGGNIVDLRGIALTRLESRLERLEDTHRSVIAAAYDNLAGTNQIHRAILSLLDASDFGAFLSNLPKDLSEILHVDVVRLVLETAQPGDAKAFEERFENTLTVAPKGFVDTYLTGERDLPKRAVTLRQILPDSDEIYGRSADWVRSEACLRLDFGPGRLPGLLVLGAEDPHKFKSTQGTDLLTFFGGVFERAMRRWLN